MTTWQQQILEKVQIMTTGDEVVRPHTLVAKLAEVMAAVHRVPKRGYNERQDYHYATEADISDAIRTELAARAIQLIPQVDQYDRQTYESAGNKLMFFVHLDMTMTVRDGEGGEEFSRPWAGDGVDMGDKAIYKAYTGAIKYFLLKLFLIPTGDDPETDSPDIQHTSAQAPSPAGQPPDPLQPHQNDHGETGMSPSGPNREVSGRSILTLLRSEPGEHGAARVLHFSDGTQTLLFTKFADIVERADQLAGSGRAIEVSWKRSESGNRYAQNIKPAQTPIPIANDDIMF